MFGDPFCRGVDLIDLPREDSVGCAGVVDEHGAVARFDDHVADQASVRRVVAKHPATTVNEHEDWEFLGDVLRADEVQDDLESVNGDDLLALGDPGVIDGDRRLRCFNVLWRLEWREPFELGRHRRVERFQECSCSRDSRRSVLKSTTVLVCTACMRSPFPKTTRPEATHVTTMMESNQLDDGIGTGHASR